MEVKVEKRGGKTILFFWEEPNNHLVFIKCLIPSSKYESVLSDVI